MKHVDIDVMNPLTEPDKVDLSRVVADGEIQGLPNIGRNFVDFVKLSSGVALGREAILGGPFKEPDVGVGAVTAGYLFVHGVKLVGRTGNLNAVATPVPVGVIPPPMPAPGQPYFGARRFPELGDIFFVTNLGDSVYHGGTLEVERRFGLGLGVHGSYTFSKTISDGGVDSMASLSDFPETPGLSERALSRQHLAHRFTLSLLAQAPKSMPLLREFKFSSLVAVESGRPYTIFTGSDANADGNPLSDRPGTIVRNTLIGPGFATVDARVARPIKLTERLNSEFSVDFFNLFNRVNIRVCDLLRRIDVF